MQKKIVDKLTDECTKTIKEVKLADITTMEVHSFKNENKYSSGKVYCIDDSIFYNFYWNYYLFCLLQLAFD